MLRRFHRDNAGKVNIVHFILLLAFIAGSYAVVMYYPPYVQFMKIRSAARQLAISSTSTTWNDDSNKSWYDAELKSIGAEYPTSRDLTYHRYNRDRVQVAFSYDYAVNHPLVGPHVLHFTFRCVANNGICDES